MRPEWARVVWIHCVGGEEDNLWIRTGAVAMRDDLGLRRVRALGHVSYRRAWCSRE